jgi:hypothetical protein
VQIDLTDYLFIEKLKKWSLPWSWEKTRGQEQRRA